MNLREAKEVLKKKGYTVRSLNECGSSSCGGGGGCSGFSSFRTSCGSSMDYGCIGYSEPISVRTTQYILVNNENPRKIEFEGVGPCTTNGYKINVAIHYPGVRRMATRFTLPGMYNYKREVAKIVSDMVK